MKIVKQFLKSIIEKICEFVASNLDFFLIMALWIALLLVAGSDIDRRIYWSIFIIVNVNVLNIVRNRTTFQMLEIRSRFNEEWIKILMDIKDDDKK